ncbi:MAG: sulfatase [Acidobacteria bacterium]|nr:sulfatase [Acidobacteriota bacterium]
MPALSRRLFLGSAASAFAAPAAPRPLNFVFILLDDFGWSDSGCYGSKFYETPNIDRLASQGMRFTDAYAACPVCSPTRASILTGKYPARLGVTDWIPGRKQWPAARLVTPPVGRQLPLEEVTLAEALKPAGYASGAIGKWHLGGEGFSPEQQGFDLNVAGNFRGSPSSYFGPFNLPGLTGSSKEDYLTDRLADEAARFIGDHRQQPFFLYLPHFAVHIPLQAKQELVARFQAKADPANPQHDPVYAAMIASADQAVGRVTAAIDESGLADRTVVIFTSDNGGLRFEGKRKAPVTSNLPLRAGKGHLYEGGIREPLIVRAPGVTRPGSVCHHPVSSVDYFPAILEMAGVRRPPAGAIDGVSFTRLLGGGKPPAHRPLFWHYPHYSNQGGVPSGAIRQDDYKLIEFYEDGRLELFHLPGDPGEQRNLVRRQPKKARQLHEALRRWRASAGAAMPTANPEYDPARADQGLVGTEPPTEPF